MWISTGVMCSSAGGVRAPCRALASAGGAGRGWAIAALALVACQDAHRIDLRPEGAIAAPRVFSWRLVAETAEMSDGAFATDREAWVVGPYGTILHTTTGGEQRGDWEIVPSNTTGQLGRIAAVATRAGAFALVTGASTVLRYSSERPAWERVDLNPVASKRPSLHVTEDGRVEAWLATLDGFAYSSDARTGAFTRAAMPPGATDVIFDDSGDSWTVAPVGPICAPYRKARGEIDWHPAPVPPRAQPLAALSLRLVPVRSRSSSARGYPGFSGAQTCGGAELLVTLQRRKLWFVEDTQDESLAEWDGKAWIRYEYPADITAALRATLPPGSVSDLLDSSHEVVLFPTRLPPSIYPPRRPADPQTALRSDPHDRALAAWARARAARFSVADLWMRDRQVWAIGREGFAHTTDGGQTWTVAQVDAPARPGVSAGSRMNPSGARAGGGSLRKLALDDRGAQGWAVSDEGDVFHYDGAWRAQLKIDAMQHALALSLSDGGNVAWLLTRDKLYRVTAAGQTIAVTDDQESMETLLVCPDGKSGWIRYGGYHWYSFDGGSWTKVNARPQPACVSAGCAQAQAQADPDTVVCAAADQIWSLRQGQTADGAVWQYPIPGLEPLQSRAAQIRADGGAVPASLIATSQDGTLLRTDGHADQPAIVDPRATTDGSRVVLSWALSGTSAVEPTWAVEYCVVYVDGVCAPDSTSWAPDSGIQPTLAAGRYLATVDPSKLSLKPETRVRYRIRMTLGGLRRKPTLVAEVTLGESPVAAAWGVVHRYVVSAAVWFAGLVVLWLFAPHALLRVNDSVRKAASEVPVLGNALGALAGFVLARKLVRTRRVVASWTARALRPPEPAGFTSISDPALRVAFEAIPSCQQAWIALHVERAARTFESSKFAVERTACGEASAAIATAAGARRLPKGVGLEDLRELVSPVSADPKLVLWIRGQGGVGKSHLACRIARWLFKQALLPHPAIVVVLDANAETQEALDALIRERLAALTQATDIDDGLVGHLLASGRVVALFDGLTERSPRTIEAVQRYLESPRAPAWTICTARSAHGFTARRSITIEPMALDAHELLPFLSSYRLSLAPALRHSEELLEPVRRAAKRIAEGERRTPLTPLLVTLLWDEAVAGAAFSSLAVEAFNNYVARALVPAGSAADLAEQRRLALGRARLLGRLALGKNYRPGRWFTRDAAANSLRAAGVGSADRDLVHDFVAAGLLEEDAPGGGQLRFLIDPLSEYLCALSILYSHDGNDAEWERFLATLDVLSPDARAAADGFLIALADCWAAYGPSLQLGRAPRVSDVVPVEP